MFSGICVFVFILGYWVSRANSVVSEFPKISDLSIITVSLDGYNVLDPNGESIESFYTLQPFSAYKIVVTKVPSDVHFIVMQVHSYLTNITLSYDKVPLLNMSVTGTNVGLVKMNNKSDLTFYLTSNSSEEVHIMVATQAYGSDAPIPGGCNMEFQVEISPFLKTTYDDAITKVEFSPAAPPLSIVPLAFLYPSQECNIKPSPVEYRMYHRYFPERDFSKETYFHMLKSMMTKSRVLEGGILAPEKVIGSPVRRIFASYPGTGNTFVVIAHFKNRSAVYVPSFTYACNDLKENNTCDVLTTTFSKVLCASIFFMGIFACFFGHYFFRIEVFLLGHLVSGLITYILVSIFVDISMALSIAVATGFFIAVVMLLFFIIPIISIVLATLTLGFLLASIIFYPLTDFMNNLFILDINYWGVFIGIVLVCPILMVSLAEKANIAACSFLGSYVAILSVDHYLGSNLRYIVINTIRRATVDQFKLAIISPPFQVKDLIMCFTWFLLMILGMGLQRQLLKNKPPFPPPVNPLKSCWKRLRGPSTPAKEPTERTPLVRGDLPSNNEDRRTLVGIIC